MRKSGPKNQKNKGNMALNLLWHRKIKKLPRAYKNRNPGANPTKLCFFVNEEFGRIDSGPEQEMKAVFFSSSDERMNKVF